MGRRADTDADFSAFVATRSHQFHRYALLLTTSHHAAEDLVQTGLAKAYASWPRVVRADDPVAYVHGIITKSFLSSKRRRSSTELPVAEVRESATSDADPTQRLALFAALAELSPIDRAVVVLRYWEDRSLRETAQALGLSEAAVKNRSARALQGLRGLLQEPATLSETVKGNQP